jgi:2-isopropylmalate synthase
MKEAGNPELMQEPTIVMSSQSPFGMPADKYRPFPAINLPHRQWPSRTIQRAPQWCSVDLRDGNQALVEPMGHDRKRRMFELLLRVGFKEIEVGFPSASQTDFDFLRWLIEGNHIPDDVTVQVLTQARPHLIERTLEALKGSKQAVVHLYNSTSTLQRRVVFNRDRQGIIDIAVEGTRLLRAAAANSDTNIRFEYSPESFTGTELDFAKDICEAVMDAWGASEQNPVILNLPATVEMSTPNVYADQIEWFASNVNNRSSYILSVHPHNDRGTSVAAAELSLLAGADRVEGTLFGNGERTGNVDIVTLALNMYTQGINPGLQFNDISEVVESFEFCNRLPVHPRHPYAGELVFTAFSGSHQDAIKKGLSARDAGDDKTWEVPYLPIDPNDLGRSYEAVIRINSQSGKGGVAYVLEKDFGLILPRNLQIEFSKVVQKITDSQEKELSPQDILKAFEAEYLLKERGMKLADPRVDLSSSGEQRVLSASVVVDGVVKRVTGQGNGPIDALMDALKKETGFAAEVVEYSEHSVGKGNKAEAVAYVQLSSDGQTTFGVGRHDSILTASLDAVLSAVHRLRNAGVAAARAVG